MGRTARARVVEQGQGPGTLRVDRKDHIAQDGDVMEFRLNV